MKLGSLNVNGINAFANNRMPGAWQFFDKHVPDILCLQETKGDLNRVRKCLDGIFEKCNYTPFVSPSKGKGGYAGVALMVNNDLLKSKPYQVKSIELTDFIPDGHPLKSSMIYYGTGRIIQFENDDMIVISVYVMNSGGKDEMRQYWDDLFRDYLISLGDEKSIYVLGDFNVCPTELDMWNWKNSINTSPGLMEFEFEKFNKLLAETGYKDSFRELHPTEARYSWSAPKVPLSKGWRLDYALTNRMSSIKESYIYPEVRCSDHVYIEIELV